MKAPAQIKRDIEIAMHEARRQHYGGHRHGFYRDKVKAVFDGEWWISHARKKGRWVVVGRARSSEEALVVAVRALWR